MINQNISKLWYIKLVATSWEDGHIQSPLVKTCKNIKRPAIKIDTRVLSIFSVIRIVNKAINQITEINHFVESIVDVIVIKSSKEAYVLGIIERKSNILF